MHNADPRVDINYVISARKVQPIENIRMSLHFSSSIIGHMMPTYLLNKNIWKNRNYTSILRQQFLARAAAWVDD